MLQYSHYWRVARECRWRSCGRARRPCPSGSWRECQVPRPWDSREREDRAWESRAIITNYVILLIFFDRRGCPITQPKKQPIIFSIRDVSLYPHHPNSNLVEFSTGDVSYRNSPRNVHPAVGGVVRRALNRLHDRRRERGHGRLKEGEIKDQSCFIVISREHYCRRWMFFETSLKHAGCSSSLSTQERRNMIAMNIA